MDHTLCCVSIPFFYEYNIDENPTPLSSLNKELYNEKLTIYSNGNGYRYVHPSLACRFRFLRRKERKKEHLNFLSSRNLNHQSFSQVASHSKEQTNNKLILTPKSTK